MSCDDIVIRAQNLTKTYRMFSHPGDRIKQFFACGLKQYHRNFTALTDVSFQVRRGETLGIIGRNGSGKSTLLQLVCGILKPTQGSIHVNGRISALLELGAGFNPEFTGRENIYFQGVLMGFTQEQMTEKFDEIAAFADIGEFIDAPVRTYSSGMFVRLAFAVAISVDPDILVVDEALSVGDLAFQAKCLTRLDAIRKQGGTVLFVSHALEQIAHHCDRVLLLNRSSLVAEGAPDSTLALYLKMLREPSTAISSLNAAFTEESLGVDLFSQHPAYCPTETRWGDRQATIEKVVLRQCGEEDPEAFIPGAPIEIQLTVRYHADIERPIYGFILKTEIGAPMISINSREVLYPNSAPPQKAGESADWCFKFLPILKEGDYLVSLGVVGEGESGITPHDRRYDALKISIRSLSVHNPSQSNISAEFYSVIELRGDGIGGL